MPVMHNVGNHEQPRRAMHHAARPAITRGRTAPASKAGELALLVVRCYRALYVLVGGDAAAMRHWMRTENRHTGGVPAEQMKTVAGLVAVLEYLDAMRGKL